MTMKFLMKASALVLVIGTCSTFDTHDSYPITLDELNRHEAPVAEGLVGGVIGARTILASDEFRQAKTLPVDEYSIPAAFSAPVFYYHITLEGSGRSAARNSIQPIYF